MCDAPIGTTSWSPAVKWNGLKKLMYRGAEGVSSQLYILLHNTNRSVWHLNNVQTNELFEIEMFDPINEYKLMTDV